jgi:hypothetical protein
MVTDYHNFRNSPSRSFTTCFNPRSESKLFCFFQVGTWNLELQFELHLLIGFFCNMLSHNSNSYFCIFLIECLLVCRYFDHLNGQCHEIFAFGFFHESVSPQA